MMNFGKHVVAAFATLLLVTALAACQKQEGPAEHAGKQVDNAINDAGRQIEKAGDKIQDTAKGEKKRD